MSMFSKAVKSAVKNPVKAALKTGLAVATGGLSTLKPVDKFINGVWTKVMEPTPGPENPYGKPDLAYLYDTSRLDPLKDSSKFDYLRTNAKTAADSLRNPAQFDFMKDTGKFDFMKDASYLSPLQDTSKFAALNDPNRFASLSTSPTNSYVPGLTSNAATFGSRYTAPTRNSQAMFDDLIGNINAPSSVDAVRGEVEGDRMQQLLGDVDEDERQSLARERMDAMDRGLGGAGMSSDIEANALAQLRAGALKSKATTRSEYAAKELDRLKAKEDAAAAAYGKRYDAGVGFVTQDTDIAARGALQDAASYNQLLGQQASLSDADLARQNTRDITKAGLDADATKTAATLTADQQQQYAALMADMNKNYGTLLSGRDTDYASLLNGRDLAAADMTQKGDLAFAQEQAARDQLYAQLLNSRDLGAAGIATNLFNAGADRELAGKEPSLFDKILGRVNIGIGI